MRSFVVLSIFVALFVVTSLPVHAQQTVSIDIDGGSREVDSGLDLAAGDFIHLRARGRWSPAPNVEPCDGNGSQSHRSWMEERHLTRSLLVPECMPMTLVGKVGDSGTWFKVGTRWETLVQQSGRLILAANDLVIDGEDGYADNQGSLELQITVTKIGGPVPEGPNGLFPVVVRVASRQDALAVEGVSGYVLGPFTAGIPAVCQSNAAALARSAQSKVTTGADLAVSGAREDGVALSTGAATSAAPVIFDGIDMSDIVRRSAMPAQMYYPSWRGMFVTNADGVAEISLLPGLYAVYLVGPDKSVTMVSGTVLRGQTNGWNFTADIKVERKEIEAKQIYEYAWFDVDSGLVWFWAEAKITGPVGAFDMINRVWARPESYVDVPLSHAKSGWNPFSVRLEDLGLQVDRDLLYATQWIPLRVGAFFDSEGKVKEVNEDNNMLIRDQNGPGVKMWWDHKKLWEKVEAGRQGDWDGYR